MKQYIYDSFQCPSWSDASEVIPMKIKFLQLGETWGVPASKAFGKCCVFCCEDSWAHGVHNLHEPWHTYGPQHINTCSACTHAIMILQSYIWTYQIQFTSNGRQLVAFCRPNCCFLAASFLSQPQHCHDKSHQRQCHCACVCVCAAIPYASVICECDTCLSRWMHDYTYKSLYIIPEHYITLYNM